jgi:hypothetical protein
MRRRCKKAVSLSFEQHYEIGCLTAQKSNSKEKEKIKMKNVQGQERNETPLNNESLLPFQYFNSLEDSLLFDRYLISDFPDVKSTLNQIWEELSFSTSSNRQNLYKDSLKCIICNLVMSLYDLSPIAVSLNKNDYKKSVRYGKLFFTYGRIVPMIKELEDLGWIHLKKGFQNGTFGRVARFWASEKLFKKLSLVPLVELKHEIVEPIILRKTKSKEDIGYLKETAYIKKVRLEIRKCNKFMEAQVIEYIPNKFNDQDQFNLSSILHNSQLQSTTSAIEKNKYLTGISNCSVLCRENETLNQSFNNIRSNNNKMMIRSTLRAIYNRGDTVAGKNFKKGGRIYAYGKSPQTITRDERKTIIINGMECAELDYSALHISMLYAQEGIQFDRDPYSTITDNPGHRPVLKKLFLILINAPNEKSAVNAVKKEIRDVERKQKTSKLNDRDQNFLDIVRRENFNWNNLIERIKHVHAPIAHCICSDAGTGLMNMDSKIILEIITHFIDKDIPCLPIHDSVIIQKQYQNELKTVMEAVYRKHLSSFTCNVEVKN